LRAIHNDIRAAAKAAGIIHDPTHLKQMLRLRARPSADERARFFTDRPPNNGECSMTDEPDQTEYARMDRVDRLLAALRQIEAEAGAFYSGHAAAHYSAVAKQALAAWKASGLCLDLSKGPPTHFQQRSQVLPTHFQQRSQVLPQSISNRA
jgi:hypothetical protein